jgi:hypothetical protein
MTLYTDLIAAGLPILSVSESGEIASGPLTDEQKIKMAEIIAKYGPPQQYAEIVRRRAAIESARNIPAWSTYTEAEADTWYQANIRAPFAAAATLAAMKAVIGTIITVQWATIRLVLALRDHNWPDL